MQAMCCCCLCSEARMKIERIQFFLLFDIWVAFEWEMEFNSHGGEKKEKILRHFLISRVSRNRSFPGVDRYTQQQQRRIVCGNDVMNRRKGAAEDGRALTRRKVTDSHTRHMIKKERWHHVEQFSLWIMDNALYPLRYVKWLTMISDSRERCKHFPRNFLHHHFQIFHVYGVSASMWIALIDSI